MAGLAAAGVVSVLMAVGIALAVAYPNLPDVAGLADYRPKLPLRVFSEDGVLIGEFGEERRNLLPIDQIHASGGGGLHHHRHLSADRGRLARGDLELEAVLLGQRPQRRRDLLRDVEQRGRCELERRLGCVQAREFQHDREQVGELAEQALVHLGEADGDLVRRARVVAWLAEPEHER